MSTAALRCEPCSREQLKAGIADYWNTHIHDLAIAAHPVGTAGFFQELDSYRYEKLSYLPQMIDWTALRGKHLLEVGCGVGTDLVRFARAGAIVTGIDLSSVAIDLAKRNFATHHVKGDLRVMDGEMLAFPDSSFDIAYAHGVLQYAASAAGMVSEIHRVLRPGGEAILMVYNRHSWLNLLSRVMKVPLEHEDAPVFRTYTIREFRRLLAPFTQVRVVPERFPVKTRLHHGLKAFLYNSLFVGAFRRMPRALVRPFGWHLIAFAYKARPHHCPGSIAKRR